MFSQRDPNYSEVRLGTSSQTIGSAGCLLCDFAQALDSLHIYMTPPQLNRYLANGEGYVQKNRIVYAAFAPLGLELVKAVDCTHGLCDDVELLRFVGLCYIVMVKVSFRPWGLYREHWLLASEPTGEDIECLDPWVLPGSNPRVGILTHYGRPSWDLARAVYGYIAFDYRGRTVEKLPV